MLYNEQNKRFSAKTAIAICQTNCLTELLAEAIYDAEACDEHLALTGRLIGPLHGIPLSLKNQIGVASHLTNAGFVTWINNTSKDDAAIVKTFRKLGAVVFARTNQPQAGMHLETSNNIYGTTVNPKNRQLTAGGSTGGEAALMGMNASVLGIGGDIGGSIRVPAAFNGVSSKHSIILCHILYLSFLSLRMKYANRHPSSLL
jgi:Asp-tRNA(Asn)/Glu-tRNA(Gln) amidotransferase A subunit family amidase